MPGGRQQATIHSFDPDEGTGEIITDSGRVLPFSQDVFVRSNLRTLRMGQRLNIEVGPNGVSRLWIDGVGPGQRIR